MLSRSIAKLIALMTKTTIQKSYLLVFPVKSNALVKKQVHASIALQNELASILALCSTVEIAGKYLTHS